MVMRFGRKTFLIAAHAASYCAAIPTADACSWNLSAETIGPNGKPRPETSAERERRERIYAKAAIKKNEKAAKKLLANGTVDVSTELARLLIPNVRSEDDGMRSSCGPWDGQDIATKNDSIIQDKDFQRAISGDPLERRFLIFYENRPQKRYFAYYLGYPVQQCNAEFRKMFQDFLTARHSADELSNIWLFLKPRNRIYQPDSLLPMRNFYAEDRKPPTLWDVGISETASKQLGQWEAKATEGKSLHATLTEFWVQKGPLLDDSWAVCPEAMNGWKPTQYIDNQRKI